MPEETPMETRARLEPLVVFGVVLVLFLGVALAFLFPRYQAIQTYYSSIRAELGSSVNLLFPGFWRDLRALKSENGTQSLESFVDTTDRSASIRQPYRCTFRYGVPASFTINFQ
ncbi:hypothetical protein [Meiothermus sp.]|uniref:hypothetical protein n=1 Tax=Meiothermus sp. TaxID=1955249 RepID=UPI0021DC2CBF|nr:hypothetical protein [Meiothermus sp.]GIW34117.1 MAG: hypothetical protein KatS3mg072_1450 [Meiothermus sp.]